MNTLVKMGRELFGLFVDDGSLALAVLGLLGVIALLVHEASLSTGQAAILLVAGIIAILLENVVRRGITLRDRSQGGSGIRPVFVWSPVNRSRDQIEMNASERLSNHILPTSATMVGVCMTVISIVTLSKRAGFSNYVDEILAFDSAIFLLSVVFSYLSIRSARRKVQLESVADVLFLIGLALMVIAAFVLSFELI